MRELRANVLGQKLNPAGDGIHAEVEALQGREMERYARGEELTSWDELFEREVVPEKGSHQQAELLWTKSMLQQDSALLRARATSFQRGLAVVQQREQQEQRRRVQIAQMGMVSSSGKMHPAARRPTLHQRMIARERVHIIEELRQPGMLDSMHSTMSDRLYNRACVDSDLQNHGSAERNLCRALKMRPEHHEARLRLGALYASKGAFTKSIREFDTICLSAQEGKSSTALDMARFNAGIVLMRLRQYAKALKYFSKCSPNNMLVAECLVICKRRSGKGIEMQEALDRRKLIRKVRAEQLRDQARARGITGTHFHHHGFELGTERARNYIRKGPAAVPLREAVTSLLEEQHDEVPMYIMSRLDKSEAHKKKKKRKRKRKRKRMNVNRLIHRATKSRKNEDGADHEHSSLLGFVGAHVGRRVKEVSKQIMHNTQIGSSINSAISSAKIFSFTPAPWKGYDSLDPAALLEWRAAAPVVGNVKVTIHGASDLIDPNHGTRAPEVFVSVRFEGYQRHVGLDLSDSGTATVSDPESMMERLDLRDPSSDVVFEVYDTAAGFVQHVGTGIVPLPSLLAASSASEAFSSDILRREGTVRREARLRLRLLPTSGSKFQPALRKVRGSGLTRPGSSSDRDDCGTLSVTVVVELSMPYLRAMMQSSPPRIDPPYRQGEDDDVNTYYIKHGMQRLAELHSQALKVATTLQEFVRGSFYEVIGCAFGVLVCAPLWLVPLAFAAVLGLHVWTHARSGRTSRGDVRVYNDEVGTDGKNLREKMAALRESMHEVTLRLNHVASVAEKVAHVLTFEDVYSSLLFYGVAIGTMLVAASYFWLFSRLGLSLLSARLLCWGCFFALCRRIARERKPSQSKLLQRVWARVPDADQAAHLEICERFIEEETNNVKNVEMGNTEVEAKKEGEEEEEEEEEGEEEEKERKKEKKNL